MLEKFLVLMAAVWKPWLGKYSDVGGEPDL
jgi:hypothetical protein